MPIFRGPRSDKVCVDRLLMSKGYVLNRIEFISLEISFQSSICSCSNFKAAETINRSHSLWFQCVYSWKTNEIFDLADFWERLVNRNFWSTSRARLNDREPKNSIKSITEMIDDTRSGIHWQSKISQKVIRFQPYRNHSRRKIGAYCISG